MTKTCILSSKSVFSSQKPQTVEPVLWNTQVTDFAIVTKINYDVGPEWHVLNTWARNIGLRNIVRTWLHWLRSDMSSHIPNSLLKKIFKNNNHNVCTFMLFRYFLLRLERLQVFVHKRRCPSMQEVEPFANLIARHKTDWSCVCESMVKVEFIYRSLSNGTKNLFARVPTTPKIRASYAANNFAKKPKIRKNDIIQWKNSGSRKLE